MKKQSAQSQKIDKIVRDNMSLSAQELSRLIFKETGETLTPAGIRTRKHRLSQESLSDESQTEKTVQPRKSGLELRGDHIVINWSSRTIITELGEFGDIRCSFDMHKAIQRSYVNMGDNETAAIVAMKFDFPHAKAVHLYARLHGFTKSSIPQTDLEFENGLTVEEAVQENIQTMKRETYKKTEKAKWTEIMKGYERWINFHHNVLKPFENHIESYLPTFRAPKVNVSKLPKQRVATVVGISDIHYMKMCFDAFGNETYNREIALEKLFTKANEVLSKKLREGLPEKFYIVIGADNIHVDNINQTTTKGTIQANSTVGSYRLELGQYLDMTMALIDTFSQVAEVEVINTPGNHDEQTSYLLGEAVKRIYDLRPCPHKVTVNVRYHERVYMQYGTNCFVFSHGSKMSLTKAKKEVHKLIMSEARTQGVNLSEVKNYVFFLQHLHHDEQVDLGGEVELIVFMSISEEDDWHQDSGFVGAKKKIALYNYDFDYGKDSVIYSL